VTLELGNGATPFKIFIAILDLDTIKAIRNFYPIERWGHTISEEKEKSLWKGKCNLKRLYIYLSIFVHITVLQKAPKDGEKRQCLLCSAIEEAIDCFKTLSPASSEFHIGNNSLGMRFFKSNILPEKFGRISENSRGLLSGFGRIIASEEQLLHFTCDGPFLR
jgi:hypothetical protein